MDNNDSNIKPQQIGGLKLMTVFVVVLTLHVLVIGGFIVYHLGSGGNPDADLLTDTTHKTAKTTSDATMASDSSSAEATPADKTTMASTTSTETASAPAPTPASTADQAAPASMADNTTPSSATGSTATTPATTPPPVTMQHGPVIVPPQTPQAPVSTPVASSTDTTPAIEPTTVTGGTPYVVKQGDSLARIAHQNHTSVAKLRAANSLTNDMLHIGQKMVIPARAQVATTTPTTPATTADAAASTTTSLTDSAPAPVAKAAAPTAKTSVAAATSESSALAPTQAVGKHSHTYTVLKGDTLTKIAHKFKTTPTAIMTANNITDAAKLSIGKKLRIPSQESRSAANTVRATPAPMATPVSAPAASAEDQQPQPSQVQTKADTTAQLANFVQ